MPREDLGWSDLLNMGVTVAAAIVLGLGAGWLVDSLADTTPIFLFLGLALGIAGAVRYTYLEFRKYLKT
ncbi:AtpZ/AtpI family protein [Jatrophihabitans sp.]|uniref:AtpZ/AtpI family protein n=1 Tax=Jatrophihabitans sp. TaxID=1932789 RepID=UPI0030C6E809|nr:putative F0F1-ATPase subunit Ca2+/Mg2+ transporter [Jatrophihabitans sp.]